MLQLYGLRDARKSVSLAGGGDVGAKVLGNCRRPPYLYVLQTRHGCPGCSVLVAVHDLM